MTLKKSKINKGDHLNLGYFIPKKLVLHLMSKMSDEKKVVKILTEKVKFDMKAEIKAFLVNHSDRMFEKGIASYEREFWTTDERS